MPTTAAADLNILKYPLDLSSISTNSWFSGFIDANGSFNVIISPRKNKNNIKIETLFRLELRHTYNRNIFNNQYGIIYYDILSIIANNLGVNI